MNAAQGTQASPVIRLQGIGKRYGNVVALKDINLDIEAGELIVFVGPSGCGKSTLLLTLGGLLRPDKGTVRVDEGTPFVIEEELVPREHVLGVAVAVGPAPELLEDPGRLPRRHRRARRHAGLQPGADPQWQDSGRL